MKSIKVSQHSGHFIQDFLFVYSFTYFDLLGRNYAAKIMHGRGELKSFMNNELDIMNILNSHKIIRIHDSFETLDSITLIMELYPLH